MYHKLESRQRRTKIVVVLFSCLFGLFLSEISLRVLFPSYLTSASSERNFFCQFDAEIGWVPLPNLSGLHQRDGFSAFVHQNRFGLRGTNLMVRERTSIRQRILVVGDSSVWGYGVDQDLIFTEPQIHQSEIDLINFGVSGYGTDQEFLFYLRLGVFFEVDEVVLVFTPYNDIANNLADEQYNYFKPYFTISNEKLSLHREHIRDSAIRQSINWVSSYSRVVNLLTRAHRTLHNWLLNKEEATPGGTILDLASVSKRDQKGIQLTLRIIAAMRDAVVANGARFSVVFVPYKPHILDRVPYNHPLVTRLAKRLEDVKIDYYEPYFIFLDDKESKSMFNKFDKHFSPKGHALFGQVLVNRATRESTKNLYVLPPSLTTAK